MKSIFSQISKFSLLNHAKRLAMAVVFLSFAAIATAGGGDGNTWNAKYYLQVHRHSLSTGSGTVYFEATDGDQYNGNSTNAEGNRVTFAANYNLSQSSRRCSGSPGVCITSAAKRNRRYMTSQRNFWHCWGRMSD